MELNIQQYLILLLGIAIGIIISLIIVRLRVSSRRQQLLGNINNSLSSFCDNAAPINYTHQVYVPNNYGVYEKRLAQSLLEISLNTSILSCFDVVNPPTFTKRLKLIGKDPNNGSSTLYGCIYWDKKYQHALFAFTGTTSSAQLVSDLQYQQIPSKILNNYTVGDMVHKGFYNIYLSIRDIIWQWWNVNKFKYLYITGHSLGGALSILCAYDFSLFKPIHYAFAPPRVGNRIFANNFDKLLPTSIRVVNTCDIVPQLPPSVWDDYIYKETTGYVPFTIALDTMKDNHIQAYLYGLPEEPVVALY